MHIEPNEIHIWSTTLVLSNDQETLKLAWLSNDERDRANRFHFLIHKRRYIAARSTLREIMSIYLNVAPQEIIFAYDDNKKPYLHRPNFPRLQFNLSHSNEIAVYAFTLDHPIGVDIEKVQDKYDEKVARRFFSHDEKVTLQELPLHDRITGFYRIWARKEAIIKAIGKGLAMPLPTFSVSVNNIHEKITLEGNETWSLIPLSIHGSYQSAVATHQVITKISYWLFCEQLPTLDKVTRL